MKPSPALQPHSHLFAVAAIVCLAIGALAGVAPAARAPVPPSVKWAWSGAVTARSAVVKASVDMPRSEVRLILRLGDDAGTPLTTGVIADADGVATFPLDGLSPLTRYRYRVELQAAAPLDGSFRTFADGPSNFRVAFASCAETGSESPVFDAIRAAEPDLFIHMGDLHYRDISLDDPALFRQAYDVVLTSSRQSGLYRQVPVAYIWDDHDFGPNNSDASSPSRPSALAAYRQFVPHYPLEANAVDGIYQSFRLGRAHVIVTDTRSKRTPGGRGLGAPTMLGRRQLQWLEEQLALAANAPLVIWVNTVPLIAGPEAGEDTWAGYGAEREKIANDIVRLGLASRLIMLSGDAHMVAIDDGSHSNYAVGKAGGRGFVVMHAAPLDRETSAKGGPYSHGVSRRRGQFGLMEVADNGGNLLVELSGRDVQGRLVPGMRLALTCGPKGCAIQP